MANRTTVRLVLKIGGINAIMRSGAVAGDLMARAQRAAAAAGEGFEASPGRPHPWVARAYVYAATPQARRREATERVLARALNAAR